MRNEVSVAEKCTLMKSKCLNVAIHAEDGEQNWIVDVKESNSETDDVTRFDCEWLVDATGRKAVAAHKVGHNLFLHDFIFLINL